MNSKQVSFSHARDNLTSILDELEKTGQPVTILRRGKPSVVIVSHEMFQQQLQKDSQPWKLAGSIIVKPGVDIDAAIEKGRKKLTAALRKRTKLT